MEFIHNQLCERMRLINDRRTIELTQLIMTSLQHRLKDCNPITYTQIFVRAAALSIQITKALNHHPLPGEKWAEFINNKLDLGIH